MSTHNFCSHDSEKTYSLLVGFYKLRFNILDLSVGSSGSGRLLWYNFLGGMVGCQNGDKKTNKNRGQNLEQSFSHQLRLQNPCGQKTRFCTRINLRFRGELFQGCIEVCVPTDQGVAFALRKSRRQGPCMLATVEFDQWCHKGLPLRCLWCCPRSVWGSSYSVSGMHCFPGFPLEGSSKDDIKGGLISGHQGRTVRAGTRADIKGCERVHLQFFWPTP